MLGLADSRSSARQRVHDLDPFLLRVRKTRGYHSLTHYLDRVNDIVYVPARIMHVVDSLLPQRLPRYFAAPACDACYLM